MSQDKSEHAFLQTKTAFKILVQYVSTEPSRFVTKVLSKNVAILVLTSFHELKSIGIDFTLIHVCYKMLNLENIESEI